MNYHATYTQCLQRFVVHLVGGRRVVVYAMDANDARRTIKQNNHDAVVRYVRHSRKNERRRR